MNNIMLVRSHLFFVRKKALTSALMVLHASSFSHYMGKLKQMPKFKVYKKVFNQEIKYIICGKLTNQKVKIFVVYYVMSLPQLAILFLCFQSIIQWLHII